MYNSEVKFVLNTSWQHENISCKMFLLHYRESMVVYTRRVCLHIILSQMMGEVNAVNIITSTLEHNRENIYIFRLRQLVEGCSS
jgi:hypothetical protein